MLHCASPLLVSPPFPRVTLHPIAVYSVYGLRKGLTSLRELNNLIQHGTRLGELGIR